MDSVVHFEIPADDKARAKAFYEKSFGWKTMDMPEMDYTILHTTETDENQMPTKPGAINGGMASKEILKAPTIVMNVENIEAAIERVKENGGSVDMDIIQVGDMGKLVYATDTEGNMIGIWEDLQNK